MELAAQRRLKAIQDHLISSSTNDHSPLLANLTASHYFFSNILLCLYIKYALRAFKFL